jgi:predicted glycoside hydrolase/deacetylase ChbG (UPF0249 family)
MSGPRRLCLCIDDVGLHPGIAQAALQLLTLQRVQALGVMVGGPALRHALPLLRSLNPQTVDVGLHLDFTEHPLRTGSRRSLPLLLATGLLRCLPLAALRAEVAAQLDAFEQALGRPPAFVDGHRHVHQMPQLRLALVDELARRGGAARPWLRCTRAPAQGGGAKARLLAQLGSRSLAALAQAHGHAQNQHLLGVYDFAGGAARYRGLLAGWLRAAEDGDLLMSHPAVTAPAADPIGAARRAEFEVLAAPDFAAELQHQGIVLMPLSRLAG